MKLKNNILEKTLRFLSFRPRSEKEVKDFLRRKKISSLKIDSIIYLLKKQGLIDDYQFAFWWVEQRGEFRPKGKKALIFELKKRGIEEKIIDKVLSSLDEKELAWRALLKKEESFSRFKGEELKRKIFNFLSSRGFSFETIEEILKLSIDKKSDKIKKLKI
ncbi:MAG: regulatory protein RecX [Microgenomates group bacterium]